MTLNKGIELNKVKLLLGLRGQYYMLQAATSFVMMADPFISSASFLPSVNICHCFIISFQKQMIKSTYHKTTKYYIFIIKQALKTPECIVFKKTNTVLLKRVGNNFKVY